MELEQHREPKPPVFEDEGERLDELRRLQLLDAASSRRFDHYTSLVAELFQFPVVLVSFVDKDIEWFKSAVGINEREIRRDISFCAHALGYEDVMVVPDARQDVRFAHNPLVTGPPYIRFYAGAVVRSPRNQPLGALCVLDYTPREFDATRRSQLRKFGDLLENEIRTCYQLDRLRDSLEHAAYFDSLTWLPNRRLLLDRLQKMLGSIGEHSELAVLAFSIPHLRLINQTFGTESTNNLLSQMGDRLIACCPPSGTVCHPQADEFILAFPGAPDDILSFAARVHSLLSEPFRLEGEDHYLNIRIGGSNFPKDGSSAAELVERASMAVGLAGRDWQQGLRYYSEQDSDSAEQNLRLQSLLRRALDEGRYHFVYQPIVSIRERTPVYAEALMRWDEPLLAQLDNTTLMALAETSGLAAAIGFASQREALQQHQQWRQDCGLEIPLSINVSALELNRPDYAHDLLQTLDRYKMEASALGIEVTEYSMVADNPAVADNIKTLRLAEIQVNVDDFGTGYSALGYLSRLAVSGIKIDRSFIENLPFSRRQAALTLTILSMADALDLSTVAEGVETREQLDFLARTNCRYAQGRFLSAPVEPDLLPRLWGHPLA